MAYVIRCKQHHGSFCDRYGTAFYDFKTPVELIEFQIKSLQALRRKPVNFGTPAEESAMDLVDGQLGS